MTHYKCNTYIHTWCYTENATEAWYRPERRKQGLWRFWALGHGGIQVCRHHVVVHGCYTEKATKTGIAKNDKNNGTIKTTSDAWVQCTMNYMYYIVCI